MFKLAPRVRETTATTGTGPLSLGGATIGMQTFVAGIATGNTTRYCIVAANGTDWEIGIGTVTAGSPDTLSRDTILASTNSGAAISLAAGTHRVFCTLDPFGTGRDSPVLSPYVPTSANTGLATWRNQGSASVSDGVAGISLIAPSNGGADGLRLRTKAISGSHIYTAHLALQWDLTTADIFGGIGFTDGTKSQLMFIASRLGGANGPGIYIINYSSDTAQDSTPPFTSPTNIRTPLLLWVQLEIDATKVYYRWSMDGMSWREIYSVLLSASYLGASGYTNLAFGLNPFNVAGAVSLLSYTQT